MIQFSKAIEHIKSDNQAGSGDILKRTIQAIQVYLKRAEGTEEEIKYNLSHVLKRLLDTFSSMSVLYHFINNFFICMEEATNSSMVDRLLGSIRDYQNTYEAATQQMVQNAYNHIDFNDKTILVHSNSQAITQLFIFLKNQGVKLTIIQTESRPAFEGVVQGKTLADLGFRIKLITDSNISRYLGQIDLAIVGADSVFEKVFVNKVGTYLIALACQDFKIPMYVIADSRKFLPDSFHHHKSKENPKPESEILGENHPNLEPENFYFEEIPNQMVTAFITDKMVLNGNDTDELICNYQVSKLLV